VFELYQKITSLYKQKTRVPSKKTRKTNLSFMHVNHAVFDYSGSRIQPTLQDSTLANEDNLKINYKNPSSLYLKTCNDQLLLSGWRQLCSL